MPDSASPNLCVDCGGEKVHHNVEYVAVLLDTLLLPFFVWPDDILGSIRNAFTSRKSAAPKHSWGAWFSTLLAACGLGKFLDEPDDATLLLDCVLWQEAKKRGIVMREFRLFGKPNNTFVAKLPSGRTISFYGIPPMPERRPAWWVNNKSILKKSWVRLACPCQRATPFIYSIELSCFLPHDLHHKVRQR